MSNAYKYKQQVMDQCAKVINDLEQMSAFINNSALTDAVEDGAQVLVTAMQEDYNKIDKTGIGGDINIVINAIRSKKTKNRVIVGPDRKASRGWQLSHILEYGTVERYMKKGLRAGNITQKTMRPFQGPNYFRPYAGKYTGVMPARSFIRTAVDRSQPDVIKAIAESLDVKIEKKKQSLGRKKK